VTPAERLKRDVDARKLAAMKLRALRYAYALHLERSVLSGPSAAARRRAQINLRAAVRVSRLIRGELACKGSS